LLLRESEREIAVGLAVLRLATEKAPTDEHRLSKGGAAPFAALAAAKAGSCAGQADATRDQVGHGSLFSEAEVEFAKSGG
jgi:hypothetical protein